MLHSNQLATMDRFQMKRADEMEIDENELWLLSYYRASELAGALVMGRLANQTDDDDLRVHLTEHAAEEANHAWLWTRTILDVGGTPRRVSETYQSRYYAEIGRPTTVLEVLALTQVFERRVMRHFRDHLRRPGTHPAVAATLHRMIEEEVGHIGWVKERLDRHARVAGAEMVSEIMRRFADVDRKVYAELLEYQGRFGELVDPARRSEPDRSRAGVERRAREVVAAGLGVPVGDLEPGTSLGMLGVDSLDLVGIVAALEDAFHVELSPAEMERLYTLDDLIGALAGRVRRS
jgi:acyl carrier protein